jgi:hypothetical protein
MPMRDYLYLWNDPEHKSLIASGIQFKDILPFIPANKSIIFLRHGCCDTEFDSASGFEYLSAKCLPLLAREEIYSWGDFCWIDFSGKEFPSITKKTIAELLYFYHTSKPYGKTAFSSLDNRFMYWSHDDGWYLKLYYCEWRWIKKILTNLFKKLKVVNRNRVHTQIQEGKDAFWISQGKIRICEKTHDIDRILNSMNQ